MAHDHTCTSCGAPAFVFRIQGATPTFACEAHGTEGEGWIRLDTPTKKTIPSVPSSMPPRNRSVG